MRLSLSKSIKGILIDIDGTIIHKGKPIEGAIETLNFLKKNKIKILYLTNTDSKTPQSVAENLRNFGFNIEEKEIFSPIIALKNFLLTQKDKKIYLISNKEIREEFRQFKLVNSTENPDFVVIGDFRDDWNVEYLNEAFKCVLNGAKLLGTQGNMFFLNSMGEPTLDTGAFVKLISDAANAHSEIFGKPSENFFLKALKLLNLDKSEVLVIGDDIYSDILGAQKVGIDAFLVRTGKGSIIKEDELKKIKPIKIIDSINNILEFL